ncbi:hypothetical protein OCU04_010758 [Sclerotinia nivalis]|uniref:Uncharacterized protein n=1 Tax=Sclerotinia nivalis TaxID=352851 RepID=A0A9X0ACV7_9HELO|nr:hypothetical protein OCU04_010758 [Sclerotinia nivalis]
MGGEFDSQIGCPGEERSEVNVVRLITPINKRKRPQPHEFREGNNIPFPETDNLWNPWYKWAPRLNEFDSDLEEFVVQRVQFVSLNGPIGVPVKALPHIDDCIVQDR